MTPAPRKRRKNNFIDNKEFYAALVAYRKQCQQAEESGEKAPIIPRYIGKCFLDIAAVSYTHLTLPTTPYV